MGEKESFHYIIKNNIIVNKKNMHKYLSFKHIVFLYSLYLYP